MTDKEYSLINHLRSRLYSLRCSAKLDIELAERKNYVYLNEYCKGTACGLTLAIELVEEMLKDLGK